MHIQPDLFSPILARSHHRQGELFDRQAATDADSDRHCPECGSNFVRTESGYLCCPRGHGKLIGGVATETADADTIRTWLLVAAELARRHARNDRWLYGRWRCICGACRFTRSR